MSRLRKDLAALEYRERRVDSVLVTELELALVLAPGLEMMVVEDIRDAGYHMSRALTFTTLRSFSGF